MRYFTENIMSRRTSIEIFGKCRYLKQVVQLSQKDRAVGWMSFVT